MFFDIKELEKRQIRFDRVFPPGTIELLEEGVKQVGDLHAAGMAELLDPSGARAIRVRGQVQGEVEALCARCLQPTRVLLARPLDLFYRPVDSIAREEEVAITKEEAEVGFYREGGLELADVVREQVLMELPMRSLCREDCKGICPGCGKNRNVEECGCRPNFADPRWDALRKWKM